MTVNEAIEWLEKSQTDWSDRTRPIAAMLREAKEIIKDSTMALTVHEEAEIIKRAERWLKDSD